MDFESILDEWENIKNQKRKKSVKMEKNNWFNEDLLNKYSPDPGILKEKETDNTPPVSSGKNVWLRRPPQDSLDLHGLNSKEAEREIKYFIVSMRKRGLRKGLIIHGKGNHSMNGSILAPLVREILEKSKEVGEFGKAASKLGGSGATWFILRQR